MLWSRVESCNNDSKVHIAMKLREYGSVDYVVLSERDIGNSLAVGLEWRNSGCEQWQDENL
jgi:hypothetical protein